MKKNETSEKKEYTPFSLLWSISRGSRMLYLLSFAFMFGGVFCGFLLPQIIRFVVDSVVGDLSVPDLPVAGELVALFGGVQALRNGLAAVGLIIIAVAAAQGACNYIYRRSIAIGAESLIKRMRDRLYEHIQYLPYSWHSGIQTGDIIQRCTSDVEIVRNFAFNQLAEMVRAVVLVVFAYSILFPMNPALAVSSFVFLPVISVYSFVFLKKVSERFLAADEAEGKLLAIAQENFTGVRVVRAFGQERREADRFSEQNTLFASLWMKLGELLSTYWGLGDFFTRMQLVTICLAGAWQASKGQLTLGEFIVFLNYNTMIIWPVRGLGRVLSEASKTGVSLGRIAEILNAKQEADPEDAVSGPDDDAPNPFEGDIVFDRVTFSYGDNPVLKDVSFTAARGKTLGILGATGSGKTTIAHLICRLYDIDVGSGEISIGGTDIRKFAVKWLRSNIGIVMQEPFLYSRTIRENIAGLKGRYSDAQIAEAAATAQIDESIRQFPNGYDTTVGERGVTLSGGERQRVAIARAILGDTPIMIFDDSLSAVDTETEAGIRAALLKRARRAENTTTIIIAHRITSVSSADHIIVMKDGAIAEQGTPLELTEANGIFKRVLDMQSAVEGEIGEEEGDF